MENNHTLENTMKKSPNFLIIHTDQHRYDCTGVANRKKGIYTPHIDSIANRGAHFSSCYATCPICIPQRLSLLTGQLAKTHGIYKNLGIPFLPLDTTLPVEMRKGGYQTALVGRNMHTYPSRESYGFEYYLPGDPSSEDKHSTDHFFTYLRDHNKKDKGGYHGNGIFNNSRAAAPFHLDDEFHQTKWATNRALEFLDSHSPSRPFMLFVGYYAPHSPHNPPADYFNRYYQRNDLNPPSIGNWAIPPKNNGSVFSSYMNIQEEDFRNLQAGYYGNIAFLDTQIGRLLHHPEIANNTYIIFTSDHGDMLGDHYMYQKSRPYEGSTHIPLCIMGPHIPNNQHISNPIGWHDLMPTILDLADITIPNSVDGKSAKNILMGKESDWREYLHGECIHNHRGTTENQNKSIKANIFFEQGSHFLTDGVIKYIWNVSSGKEQLFDLINDWTEIHDLATAPGWKDVLLFWRNRLIQELKDRPEGFTDGKVLISGKEIPSATPQIQALIEKRHKEGFSLAYEKQETPLSHIEYTNHFME